MQIVSAIVFTLAFAYGVSAATVLLEQTDATIGFNKEYKLNMKNAQGQDFGVIQTVMVRENHVVATKTAWSHTLHPDSGVQSIGPNDLAHIALKVKDQSGKDISPATVDIRFNDQGSPASSLKYVEFDQSTGSSNQPSNKNNNNSERKGESKKTLPDGTVETKFTRPDGTQETVIRNPDGSEVIFAIPPPPPPPSMDNKGNITTNQNSTTDGGKSSSGSSQNATNAASFVRASAQAMILSAAVAAVFLF